MPTFAVEYVYDQRADERDRLRPEHRAHLRTLVDQGVLLASGPWSGSDAEPPGALLLVRADDGAAAVAAFDDDPFVRAGLVAERRARQWDPVIGPWA